MNTTNQNIVSKTLIAVLFASVSVLLPSVPGFAAEVGVNASTSTQAQTSAEVDSTENGNENSIGARLAARSDNSTSASADEKAAVERAENASNESKDEAVSLGENLQSQVSESGSAILEDAAELEGSIAIDENVDLLVETVDGVAIDLTTDTVAEVGGSFDSLGDDTNLGDSEQTVRALTDAASESSVDILGNTTGMAGDVAESVEAGADIGNEVDTIAESSSELPEMEDQRADIESATTNQTSGGLGLL